MHNLEEFNIANNAITGTIPTEIENMHKVDISITGNFIPSQEPTEVPTSPTEVPTGEPIWEPSQERTKEPAMGPTSSPTFIPTSE